MGDEPMLRHFAGSIGTVAKFLRASDAIQRSACRKTGVESKNCRAGAVTRNCGPTQILGNGGRAFHPSLERRRALAHGLRWNGNSAGAAN